MNQLKLVEFRTIYTHLKRNVIWWDHLLLGLLVWVEDKIINSRIKTEVDEAIKDYHEVMDKVDPVIPPPIYTETLSEGSTNLPEMRLTAPWYKEADKG